MKHEAIVPHNVVISHEVTVTIERMIIAQDGHRHLIVDVRRMNAGLVDNDELARMDNVLAIAVKITVKTHNGTIIAHYER